MGDRFVDINLMCTGKFFSSIPKGVRIRVRKVTLERTAKKCVIVKMEEFAMP